MRPPSPAAASRTPCVEIRPGVWLDSRLALWLEAERLLVVADLHWGYGASHQARGHLLPLWGDDEIEARLRALIAHYQPAEMIWLGDVVHAVEGRARAERFLRDASLPIAVLAGNHDRRWPGAMQRTRSHSRYFFHHGDRPETCPPESLEIIGHHHPALSWWDGAGGRLKLPALIASERRLILPAFSPWAAGTAWNEQLGPDDTLWAIAPTRIFALPKTTAIAAAAAR